MHQDTRRASPSRQQGNRVDGTRCLQQQQPDCEVCWHRLFAHFAFIGRGANIDTSDCPNIVNVDTRTRDPCRNGELTARPASRSSASFMADTLFSCYTEGCFRCAGPVSFSFVTLPMMLQITAWYEKKRKREKGDWPFFFWSRSSRDWPTWTYRRFRECARARADVRKLSRPVPCWNVLTLSGWFQRQNWNFFFPLPLSSVTLVLSKYS